MSKLSLDIPPWLMRIPPGVYTAYELANLGNVTDAYIYIKLKLLGVERVVRPNHRQKCFDWKGAAYYLHKKQSATIDKIIK